MNQLSKGYPMTVVDYMAQPSGNHEPTDPPPTACHTCKRELVEGEAAWASDWKVLTAAGFRSVTRYTCDDCEPAL